MKGEKMKKTVVFLFLFLLAAASWAAPNRSIIDPSDISIKAGPTDPGEKLSMVWMESFVYPKMVTDDRIISLGVRTTTKVKLVDAAFDFGKDKLALTSNDGLNWSGAYKIPESIASGLHVVRYNIAGAEGNVQRSVDFFVEKSENVAANQPEENVSRGEAVLASGWPITVTSTCSALVGGSGRILYAGQKLVGVVKVPWYKVVFEDGEEGWVSASSVKEPLDEYFQLGSEAFQNKNYLSAIEYLKDTIAINPEFVKGYTWLARSYIKNGDNEAAYRTIKEAMRLDDRDVECKVVADSLAQIYHRAAHLRFKSKRYNEAVAAYQKAVDLRPNFALSWIELGKSYESLGFAEEAKSAWREALKMDPGDKEIYALLGIGKGETAVAQAPAPAPARSKVAAAGPVKVSPTVAKIDPLAMVKDEKTKKGTKIASAIRSVVALTKSLGTPVAEKGWQIKKQGEKYLVRYLCEQGKGAIEAFEWVVDVSSRRVSANNSNAELLMDRW